MPSAPTAPTGPRWQAPAAVPSVPWESLRPAHAHMHSAQLPALLLLVTMISSTETGKPILSPLFLILIPLFGFGFSYYLITSAAVETGNVKSVVLRLNVVRRVYTIKKRYLQRMFLVSNKSACSFFNPNTYVCL